MTRVQKSVSLELDTVVDVEEYQKKNEINDFSNAVENLIRSGLNKK